MQRVVWTLQVLACALAAGCGSAGDDGMMQPGIPEIELGTGTVYYERFTDGQEIPLYQGPQGGFHFLMHARMRGMQFGDDRDPEGQDNPVTEFSAFDARSTRVDLRRGIYTLGYRPVEGGDWGELPSGKIIEVRNELAMALLGTEITLRVQITDVDGLMAEDIVRVRVQDEFAR